MAMTEEDLVVLLVAVIDQYGDNMNLKINNIKSLRERLEKEQFVRIGYNPCPGNEAVILTALVGETQIREWERIEKMLTCKQVGEA
jgi:hypothetical protein